MEYDNTIMTKNEKGMDCCYHWDKVKYSIYPVLLPYGSCVQCLPRLVHDIFLDLMICYQIRMPDTAQRALVTKKMLGGWEISSADFQRQAEENMRTDGYETLIVSKLIGDMIAKECKRDVPDMVVLTNRMRSYGAAGILYLPLLKDYADWMQCNLLLLPSSIHEWMVLPDDGSYAVEDLKLVVEEMNQEYVSVKEYLSDRIYCYDREKGEVVIAA